LNTELLLHYVQDHLSERRWLHCQGVAAAAATMARRFGVNEQLAGLAGLIHDLARELSAERLLSLATDENLPIDPVDRSQPMLLHGPVAALLLRRDWGVENEELLEAVAQHTLGGVQMGRLAKIIYVADLIELGRSYPGVEHIRALADIDLNQALRSGFDHTLRYCLEQGRLIHPRTILARNQLLSEMRATWYNAGNSDREEEELA